MAKTLADCRTLTRVYLDEVAQADWLDSEVLIGVNTAYQDVVSRVMEIYENFYETVNPFTYKTVANTQEYAIDSSIIKITRVEINYVPSSSNNFIRAIRSSMDEVLVQLNQNPSPGGAPLFNAAYYIHGNQTSQYIGFIPIPTSSDDASTNSIKVWGITTPSDLANDSDAINIPYADNFYQLICMKAAALLLSKGQQEENPSTKLYALYEQGITRMQTFIKERQSDGLQMIIDAEAENLDFESMAPF